MAIFLRSRLFLLLCSSRLCLSYINWFSIIIIWPLKMLISSAGGAPIMNMVQILFYLVLQWKETLSCINTLNSNNSKGPITQKLRLLNVIISENEKKKCEFNEWWLMQVKHVHVKPWHQTTSLFKCLTDFSYYRQICKWCLIPEIPFKS